MVGGGGAWVGMVGGGGGSVVLGCVCMANSRV